MKKFLARALYGIFILLLAGMASLFFAPLLPIKGNIEIKIVKSGSMEPAISTGGIVVIKPATNYSIGDIITFGEDSPTTYPTTHRIVSVSSVQGETLYQVKGDVNEEPDPTSVKKNDVIGKVIFTVPNAGYLLDFARQPVGFILLIAFPAALVILNEIIDIFNEIRQVVWRRKEKSLEKPVPIKKALRRIYQMDDVLRPVYLPSVKKKSNTPVVVSIAVLMTASFALVRSGSTVSYFSDIEKSLGNTMSATSFSISALATPEESYIGESGGSIVVSTVTPTPEGLPHEYRVTIEKKGGSDAFCQALIMSSSETPPFAYDGPILNFSSPPTIFSGGWQFGVDLSPDAEDINEDDICIIDFVYSANTWLEDEGLYGGYSDVERVTLTFEAEEEEELYQGLPLIQEQEEATSTASTTPEVIEEEIAEEEHKLYQGLPLIPEEVEEVEEAEEVIEEDIVADIEEEVSEETNDNVEMVTEEEPAESVEPEAVPIPEESVE